MALYKLFLRPIDLSLCSSCAVRFMKSEVLFIKQVKVNYKKKYFTTSVIKDTRWHIKNAKSPQSQQKLGEKLENQPNTPHSFSLLLKPFLFTIIFSGATFAATAIWQYENIRRKALLILKNNWFSDKLLTHREKKYSWREKLNKTWNKFSEGQKLFAPICLINVLVFLAWKVKRFQPTMIKYFCCTPFGEVVCWPMILTAFSHYSFFHLAANMYVLYSFSTSGVEDLGKEQFLGLYLAGGVISSFLSYLYKFIKSQHTLSIGASGAIMSIVAYICVKYPDSKLSLILLPWVTFSAGSGIKFLVGLDIIGVIRSWTYFDHAAHLGGSLCGVGWCYWGNTYIWQRREPILEWWHEIRSSK